MSTIAAGTTSGTALVSTGNTTGELQLQVNGTTPSVTLAANGSIGVGSSPSYGNNGQLLTSSGTGSAPTWTTLASGLAAATQAEMEAASSASVLVTPARQNFHPSAAKAWVYFTGSAGTYTAQASYGYTSFTDNGVGDLTITWGVTFSSINYGVMAMAGFGSARLILAYKGAANTTTTSRIKMVDATNNADDTDFLFVAVFGDLA